MRQRRHVETDTRGCRDCGLTPDVDHFCREGEAKCSASDHRWVEVTTFGSPVRELLCGRWRCGAAGTEPFEEMAL